MGYLESFALLFGLCIGPGLSQLPEIYQHGGFAYPSAILCVVAIFAFTSCLMIIYSQSRISVRTHKRFEFISLCKELLPVPVFILLTSLFILALLSISLGGMLQVTQAVDYLIAALAGKSCGIRLLPTPVELICENLGDSTTPFSPGSTVISLGYIASSLLIAPFSFIAFSADCGYHVWLMSLLFLGIVSLVACVSWGEFDVRRVPIIVPSWRMSKVLGVALFNFTLVFSVPSWNNQRLLTAGAKRSLGLAMAVATLVLIGLGYFLAASLAELEESSNLIDAISRTGRLSSIACVAIVSLVDHLTSLPVVGIMLQHTLMTCIKMLRRHSVTANIFSVVIPWLAVVPLYNGEGLAEVIEFGGLVFTGITCFIIPPILFLITLRQESKVSTEEEDSENDLLMPHSIVYDQSMISRSYYENDMLEEQFPQISSRWRAVAYGGACFQLVILSASLCLSIHDAVSHLILRFK